jgi:hypothetical protein
MGIPPISRQTLTLDRLWRLLDPGRVFYRPAVEDTLVNGDLAEIQLLIKGAKEVKAKYGDLDGLIRAAEVAAKKVQ